MSLTLRTGRSCVAGSASGAPAASSFLLRQAPSDVAPWRLLARVGIGKMLDRRPLLSGYQQQQQRQQQQQQEQQEARGPGLWVT